MCDIFQNIIKPTKLSNNQIIKKSQSLMKDIIVTVDKNENRVFGGAFRKISINGIEDIFVSSTLSTDELKQFVNEFFEYSFSVMKIME